MFFSGDPFCHRACSLCGVADYASVRSFYRTAHICVASPVRDPVIFQSFSSSSLGMSQESRQIKVNVTRGIIVEANDRLRSRKHCGRVRSVHWLTGAPHVPKRLIHPLACSDLRELGLSPARTHKKVIAYLQSDVSCLVCGFTCTR